MRISFAKLKETVWTIVAEAVKLFSVDPIKYGQHAVTDGKDKGCRFSLSGVSVVTPPDNARFALFAHIEEAELEIKQEHERHVVWLKYSAPHKKLFDKVFNDLAKLQSQYPNILIRHTEVPEDEILTPES